MIIHERSGSSGLVHLMYEFILDQSDLCGKGVPFEMKCSGQLLNIFVTRQ